MSIQTVESSIINILNTVPGITVYDHEPKLFQSLPAVTVQYSSLEQTRHKFSNRIATYVFFVRLYVDMGTDAQTGFDSLKDLVDQILFQFNQKNQMDLNMSVLRQDVTAGSLNTVVDVQNPYYLHEFTVTIQEEV